MVKERLLRVLQTELFPNEEGRKLSYHLQDAYRSDHKGIRRERLARQTTPRTSVESLRNQVVIQEIKLVYNQLTGVGDQLLDLKLHDLLPESQSIASLGRAELCALNFELAKTAGSIFGPAFANHAYDRIGSVIQRAYG